MINEKVKGKIIYALTILLFTSIVAGFISAVGFMINARFKEISNKNKQPQSPPGIYIKVNPGGKNDTFYIEPDKKEKGGN